MSNPNANIPPTPPSRGVKIYTSKPKPRKRLGLFLGLAGVAIASAVSGALLAVSIASTPLLQNRLAPEDAAVFDQGDDISTGMNFRMPRLTRPVNILVLGVKVLVSDLNDPPEELQDLGYDALVNSFQGLSDTMLLLRFNPATGQVVVLSIPRDTRTYIEGVGLGKLNAANVYGGPALSATTVSDLLGGVPIDRYVRINVQGVEKLIDALGGVEVYVPQDMKYTDESQHLYINLKQGEQRLDGDQSLQFLRFRYDANGDIGRVQRQQMFLRSLMEQALSPATVTRLPQILSVIQENVDTNLSVEELVALVGYATQTDRSDVQMLLLPGTFSSPGEYDLSYWLPSERQIDQVVEQYFGETVLASDTRTLGSLNVAIQDTTGDEEAVQYLEDVLLDEGVGYIYQDDPWDESQSVTRIIAQRGDVASATMLQDILGVGEVVVESTGDLQSDITVRLGTDWLQNLPQTVDSVE